MSNHNYSKSSFFKLIWHCPKCLWMCSFMVTNLRLETKVSGSSPIVRSIKTKKWFLFILQIKNRICYKSLCHKAFSASSVIAILFLWQWYISCIFILNVASFKVKTQTIRYKSKINFLPVQGFVEKSIFILYIT